jgi:dimethylhistidine N-methyltransferase
VAANLTMHDFEPSRAEFLRDVSAGLRRSPKQLPCKYLYDERGSALFDEICGLDEYYPTRTEIGIMEEDAGAMARALGPEVTLIEYGSGSGLKTRLLLDELESPTAYVPVDISREHLARSAAELASEYPKIPVLPICADFTGPFELPEPVSPRGRAAYFPGSTIGNFERKLAAELLAGIAASCGEGGALLIGVDLQKDVSVLVDAYDDARGVTADFNRNLLVRINRELGANFDVESFAHRALWKPDEGRIEMHLVSEVAQNVDLGDETMRFAAGESICTEHSHKYTVDGFAELAEGAGFRVEQVFTDPEEYFSVQLLEVDGCPSTSRTART